MPNPRRTNNRTSASFAQRLESELNRLSITQIAVATRLGISQGTVSGWFNRGYVPQPRILFDLAEMLGVRPEWLVDGKEPKLNDRSKRAGEQVFSGLPLSPEMRGSEKKRIPIAENAVLYGREPRMIPVLSWAQAGMAADFEEIPIDWQETIPSTVGDRNAVAIMLRGDSMEPKHSEGDIAVVMPTTAARHGDLVIAKIKEEGLVFKIFNLIGGDPRRIRLSSYNPAYSPNEYGREDFHFIFPVHSVTRLTRR